MVGLLVHQMLQSGPGKMEVSHCADAETVMGGGISHTSVVYSCYQVTGVMVKLIYTRNFV